MKNLNDIKGLQRQMIYSDYNGDEKNGMFILNRKLNNKGYPIEIYMIIASSGGGFDHVSVTLHRANGSLISKCPSYEDLMIIKEKLFGDEVVYQIHPKKEDYVNDHPYCLHLWRPNTVGFDIPDMNIKFNDLSKENILEYNDILVCVKKVETLTWYGYRVYCLTRNGNVVKSGPSWDIMCTVKEKYIDDDIAAFEFFKKEKSKEYVDIWVPKDPKMVPTPPSTFVGKTKKYIK